MGNIPPPRAPFRRRWSGFPRLSCRAIACNARAPWPLPRRSSEERCRARRIGPASSPHIARRRRGVFVPLLGHAVSLLTVVVIRRGGFETRPYIKSTVVDCNSKHTEVLRDDGIVELDRIGGAAEDDAPGIDDDNIVGEIER